jgi:hypothetical protein
MLNLFQHPHIFQGIAGHSSTALTNQARNDFTG